MNSDFTDEGKLQVIVSAGASAIPVSDATVRVTDGLGNTILDELSTDSSGQTPVVDLPAPPVDYSVEPTDQKPYSTYNVTIRASEFETLHIGGVQILSKSTALQRAALKTASANGFNVRNLSIEPHTLWGDFPPKIPEDEVKPLPESSGLVVLPKPVVPEFVIVHLGAPTDPSAQNVWVPFRDYIKNVASCEIYSTWAAETIKANVLAIISFTMNRVFTEWYRGKGYDFTVTNSTAFDQAFSYGRNIYADISVAVDDLFNTYITKEGIMQPLLTQYCDGKRTQCSGLSQWGSQSLGEQGQDAITILRNYYGSEIYLASAEKVEGVPRSFGGEVLQVGSSGEAVRTIQTQLNSISDHYPAIRKLKVDSYFGEETEAAVKKFQEIFHLPQTGAVDFATWYAISNIYVGVEGLA
jgi:peptidoglycan hydrolase-like protein with peptidoglycan-binding domain